MERADNGVSRRDKWSASSKPLALRVGAERRLSTSSESSHEYSDKIVRKRSISSTEEEPMNFPKRLMRLLQRNERPDAIYWLPEGKMFAMQTDKIDEVLGKNFQGAKLMSFTRTLNKWGFRKALGQKLPEKVVAYQNPYFQRDDPELVRYIRNHKRAAKRRRDEAEAQNVLRASLQQTASRASSLETEFPINSSSNADLRGQPSILAHDVQSSAALTPPASNLSILNTLGGYYQMPSSISDPLGPNFGTLRSASVLSASLTQARAYSMDPLPSVLRSPLTSEFNDVLLPQHARRHGRERDLDAQHLLMQSLARQEEQRHRRLQENLQQQQTLGYLFGRRSQEGEALRSELSVQQELATTIAERYQRQHFMLPYGVSQPHIQQGIPHHGLHQPIQQNFQQPSLPANLRYNNMELMLQQERQRQREELLSSLAQTHAAADNQRQRISQQEDQKQEDPNASQKDSSGSDK